MTRSIESKTELAASALRLLFLRRFLAAKAIVFI
jgi:hypothetical protein